MATGQNPFERQIRNKTVADSIKDGVLDHDRACAHGDQQQGASEDQPRSHGRDESRHAELRDRRGGQHACQHAHDHYGGDNRVNRPAPEGHRDRRKRAEKASKVTDRKFNVADDDDEGHSHCQNRDVTHLVDQVADIPGGDKNTVSRDCEEDHDDNQSDKHKIIADIAFQDVQQAF